MFRGLTDTVRSELATLFQKGYANYQPQLEEAEIDRLIGQGLLMRVKDEQGKISFSHSACSLLLENPAYRRELGVENDPYENFSL